MRRPEPIDPEEDAERVPLPGGLLVLEGALRFHARDPETGGAVCSRGSMLGNAPTMSVEEARERHGLAACRSCFHEVDEGIPEEVVVLLGRQANKYHAPGEDGGKACHYGGHDVRLPPVVTVPREKAEKAGLGPCNGCFGADGEFEVRCPLCKRQVGARDMVAHLGTPPDEGCPETPQSRGGNGVSSP